MAEGAATQRWSTGGTALAEREEAVREALGGTHLPWDLRVPDPRRYACELTWHPIGGTTLVECRSTPVAGRRAAPELRRTDAESVAILVLLEGRERVRQGDVVVEMVAGDALLWASDAPAAFEVVDAVHKLTLLIPADRLHLRRGLGPVAMPGSRAPVQLLGGHLQTLARIAAGLTAVEGHLAVDVALDLLAAATAEAPPEPPAATAALVERALELIARDLGDPDLGPPSLAAALGISPRYLHMAFATTGETVAAHIRRRRLERVRHDLADPGQDAATITAIAHRWGFGDSGHLSRVFRGEHGMTPSAFRRTARGRRSPT